jgi:F-type H+-transporting ATPase subunit delta
MKKKLPIQYAKILYGMMDGEDVEDIDRVLEAFIKYLKGEHALSKMDYIIREFEKYANSKQGVVEIDITSARKLERDEIDQISKKFGKSVRATNIVDESILGGVIIREGNEIFDASISTQLKRLKSEM